MSRSTIKRVIRLLKQTPVVRFEVSTAMTMKNGVFWDVIPCGSSQRESVAVTANVVPSSPILVTPMMAALSSSEASVLTRATRRNIPEDAILQTPVGFLSLSTPLWIPLS
jgi:hypothetical protein